MRKCVQCGAPIPLERMVRGKWKAIYCCEAHHLADRQAIREAKKAYREARGLCHVCGRKPPSAREQSQKKAISGIGGSSGG